MNFRLSREDEYAPVRRLWGQCFGEEEPWTSWYFSRHYRADQIWVGVEDGNILAQAHLLPYRLMLRGSWREAVYFVGVCVEEELRGTGIGRDLMASALGELKRTGVGVSILQPRWPVFYRKLGWDYCYSRQKYSMALTKARQQLNDFFPEGNWTPDEQVIEPLATLYENFVRTRHGYAWRGRQDWDDLLADHRSEGGRVGIFSRDGIPAGYVLYKTQDHILRVREMVWRDNWVVDALWQCLVRQAGLTGDESLEWDDPAGNPGSILYSDTQSEPFLMGRITDIQTVLAELEYPTDLSMELDLTVTDSLTPWNEGAFHWSIRQGKSTLLPLPPGLTPGPSVDIGAMSRVVFGERSVREILAARNGNRWSETDLAILEQAFPVCRNFISEYY